VIIKGITGPANLEAIACRVALTLAPSTIVYREFSLRLIARQWSMI
jgi:hypothetical protein